MKVYLTFYLAIIISTFCFSQDDVFHNRNLPPQQLKQDFSILKSSLEYNHPDLYLYTPKERLDSLFFDIENELEKNRIAIDFFKLLTPLQHQIGNNHTVIMPPAEYLDYIKTKASLLPFILYFDDNSYYVLADGANEYILKEGAIIESCLLYTSPSPRD